MYEYYETNNINLSIDIDIECVRDNFAIRSSLIRMELEEMLEKTKKIEALLGNFCKASAEPRSNSDDRISEDLNSPADSSNQKELRPTVSNDDFYKPDPETPMPPKKRMKV